MSILTYKDRQFYMDGKPFTVISGAMHYFRIPREYWYDRLLKLKECGFNTVETYTCWNLHEENEGEFNFSGMLDVEAYIDIAKDLGLNVIIRPGPFICAEWEFGGLPAWLLRYPNLHIRCMDEVYVSKVKNYYKELCKRLRPRLAVNGGNIIMMQVENEYGFFGNDKEYLHAILDIYKELDMDCLFFTSDGTTNLTLTGGTLPECLATANFGSRLEERAEVMLRRFPNQPFMCMEFWCGWFDHWGNEHHTREADDVANCVKTFIDHDWSFNVYMFHGGTSFGFMNGANYSETAYLPTVNSYDYYALLNEAGDRTEAYYQVRNVLIEKYGDAVPALTATETQKMGYGKVRLTQKAELFKNLEKISTPIHSSPLKFMEEVGQNFGFILYRTKINGPIEEECGNLTIECVHDRAGIFIDGERKATYQRWQMPKEEEKINIALGDGENVQLDILVENMGRVNIGPKMPAERKGISGARVLRQHIFGWDIYPLPMKDLSNLEFERLGEEEITQPIFLKGELIIDEEPKDTFMRTDGFKRGFVKINGFNVGRFDERGPQKTLYIPAPFLKKGKNEILVFDADGTKQSIVEFCGEPDLG